MTPKPQPNNATPQRLHLNPQTIPRMPFSSPMGEEVLSPTSPNASRSPPQHQIKLSQSNDTPDKTAGDEWRLPSERPRPGERKKSQENGENKLKWPGLNVVTNFTKAPSLTQKTHGKHGKQNAGLGLKQQTGNPNATSRKPSVETLGLGHQPSGKSLKSLGSKGRLGDLKRTSSKWSTLSPSDRAVVIGISVSPEELAQQAVSPDASPARTDDLVEQHATARLSPNMPTILVTPAKEEAPWSTKEDEDPVELQRRRIASSVYSQMPLPKNGGHDMHSANVPPVPPLPPDAQDHSASGQNKVSAKRDPTPRIMSTCTDIDEGESPDMHDDYRPGTGESQLKILTNKASMDTLATRHRSEGWWNHIISPFFPKSPMTFKTPISPREKKSGTQSEYQPYRQNQNLQEARQTFPPPPDSASLKSGHTSWTDADVDVDLANKRLELDGFRDRSTLIMDEPQEDPVRDSALLPTKFEGFGQAAEYYEACLYDMHSPTPYFECLNHTCLPYRHGTAVPLPTAGGGNANSIGGGEETTSNAGHKVTGSVEKIQPLAAQQTATNRFSAAFHEAITPKAAIQRPMSDATVIEDLDMTPDVQEAHAAPVVRAPVPVSAVRPPVPEATSEPGSAPVNEPGTARENVETPRDRSATPHQPPSSTSSPARQERPAKRYVAVMPPEQTQPAYDTPLSPGPLSPGQQKQAPKGAIPLQIVGKDNVDMGRASRPADTAHHEAKDEPDHTTLADLYPPPRNAYSAPKWKEIQEKDVLPTRPPKERKSFSLPACRSCFCGGKPPSKKQKWIMIAISSFLILMIILVLVLVMTLTKKGDTRPIQSSWLNLTDYPPIPTGISTIVQPNAVDANPDCVQPATMWSCALPKEQQQGLAPNAPDQPNFRVEIVFQNGTNATANTTAWNTSNIDRRSYGHAANAVSAGDFVRGRLLRIREAFAGTHYDPSPSPPSLEDQTFLGNTTDRNAAPFDGEYTPFFMSFMSTKKLSSRLRKREESDENGSEAFHNITKAIPPPDSNPDGTAAAVNLYPFPTAQPLRLYDRGLDTEHYGFYTYFDRSIFLKSAAPLSDSGSATPVPGDENGGADENAASVRCTWAQTRFLVQIWTKKGNSAILLSQSTNDTTKSSHPSAGNATTVTSSSANDFTQPGSFPYPVTITLDRHGGEIDKKMVYCYGLDDREHINATQIQYQLEDRGVGGQLVNPALGPFGDVNVTSAQGGPGGIDGGNGGCLCKWQNFGTGF